MRFVTYTDGNASLAESRVGVLHDDQVTPMPGASGALTMREYLQGGPDLWAKTQRALVQSDSAPLPLSTVRLLAPIPNPSKVVAIGLNYMDHVREQKVEAPNKPLIFAKFPSAIIGPGDNITWNTNETNQVDYEVELGVVIGTRTRNVALADALHYVFGYTVLNDVSARDLQFGDGQWVRGKSLDTFCPIGPAIVTTDEVPDPQKLALRCLVNGEALQNSSTSEMIFGVAELVSFISRFITLEPGDIIATGTPNGVGVFRTPKVFLKDGDTVVAEVEGVGRLENRCRVVG